VADDGAKRQSPGSRSKREAARIILGVVLAALLIAFVVDNTGRVKVGFVFADRSTRLIYVLVVTAAIGVILDRLWMRARRKR
jgi:uncharacterized integral membrane protein